jgi:uncharacterized membrane protein (DUF4010 family)
MLLRGTKVQQPDEMLRNPFELRALLVFAALFAAVSTASAALVGMFGGGSLPATSALSGMFDVDVAVLSAVRLDGPGVGLPMIGAAILAALASNAVGRMSLAVLAGPVRFWAPLLGSTLVAAAVGAVVAYVTGVGL